MAKKFVDLSDPIDNEHFRYKDFIREMEVTKDGVTRKTSFMSLSHGFTHIDAPLHMVPGGKVLEDFDLFSFLIGHASVIDVSDVKPNEPITAEKLRAAYESGCEYTDFLIVKTSWGTQRDSFTPDFWNDAPYLTKDGVEYLVSLKPKVIGYDFPQDEAIRHGPKVKMTVENSPTHFLVLPNDILMIEYMNNLWNLPVKNCEIYALPLNIRIPNNDCAQIHVVAAYEE